MYCGLEKRINMLLHKYHTKCEVFGEKLNGVNCRRLMKNDADIIDRTRLIFILWAGIVSDDDNIFDYK